MKTLSGLLLFFAVLTAAGTVLGSVFDDDDRNIELFILSQQSLTPQNVKMICTQQLTAYQAAQQIRAAGRFQNYSVSFAPYLHELYYRLGQLTHRHDAVWTPETMDVCVDLMRYIALFRTTQKIKSRYPAILCALNTPADDPCTPLSGIEFAPEWYAVRGDTLQIPLAVMPRRALKQVKFIIEPWRTTSGIPVNIPCQLLSVKYRLQQGVWERSVVKTLPDKLTGGIEFLQFDLAIPPSIQPGIYSGKIILKTNVNEDPEILNYTLNIK